MPPIEDKVPSDAGFAQMRGLGVLFVCHCRRFEPWSLSFSPVTTISTLLSESRLSWRWLSIASSPSSRSFADCEGSRLERHREDHRPTIESLLIELIELVRVKAHDNTVRRLLHAIDHKTDAIERKLAVIIQGERILMSLSQTELAAFAALIADIDEKFTAANAPLVDELRAQVAALQAEDDIDQAEVDRLTALIATSEQDTLDAIQGVKDHVDTLGGTSTPAPTPEPAPEG